MSGSFTRRLAVLIASALALNLLPFAMSPAHAAVGATAEVDVKTAYRGETATYTITVNNTSTAGEGIGSVALAADSTIFTVNSCASTGWPAGSTGFASPYSYCLVNSGAAADIPAGGSRIFTVVARVSNTTVDQPGATWSVSVDGDSTYNMGANSGTASATGAGLGTAVYVWRLTDAVVATSTTAIGSACPAPNKKAPAGATRVITLCGSLSGSTAEVSSAGSPASVGGTLLSGIGTYSASATPITPPATNRVVANWIGNTIGSAGGGKTLIARIRSVTNETSPLTTLNGYQSTSAPTAGNDSVTVAEDSGASTIGVLANDADADGDAVSVVPSSGTTSKGSFSCTAANCSYTPNQNENGSDSFGYTITDGSQTATATVNLTITPSNDKPMADAQSVLVDEDQSTSMTLTGSDVETASLTYVIASLPNAGKLYVGTTTTTEITTTGFALPGDQVTYVPDPNSNGNDSFTFEASDGALQSDPATVTLTVDPVDDAPVCTGSFGDSTDEDVDLEGSVSCTDADGDPLTYSIVSGPSNGSFGGTFDPDGSFTYTPDANFNGSDSFTFRANDGTADSGDATFDITVDSVNDAPVCTGPYADATDEDANLEGSVSCTDADADPLTYSIVSGPSNGSFGGTFDPDGSFTYTPDANFNGSDSFTFRANDGTADSGDATFDITVDSVNDAPVAGDDTDTTAEDTQVDVSVLANDSDVDDGLSVQDATDPADGSVTCDSDSCTYTPDPDFNGSDTFDYTVSDGNGGTDTATVTVIVGAVNDAPVAGDDSGSTVEDTSVTTDVTSNDTDPDGDSVSITSEADGANGTATCDAATGECTFDPNPDFNGVAVYGYTVSDGNGGTDSATVTVTVAAVNDAPVAGDDSDTTAEDTSVDVSVLANDSDADDDALTVQDATDPATGSVTCDSDSCTYTPDPDFNGSDSFDYTVSDGNGESDSATVTVTVDPVNDAPVAVDQAVSTDEDVPLLITLPTTDGDDSTVGIDVRSLPATGLLYDGDSTSEEDLITAPDFFFFGRYRLAGDQVTYVPNLDQSASDSFAFTANDGTDDSDVATVTVTVDAVNDAPVAGDDSDTTAEDTSVDVSVLANDSDVDNDALTVQDATDPATGSVTCDSDSCTYTPDPDFNGSDSFDYTVSDGNGESDTATVTVIVDSINDAPVAGDDSDTTAEDTSVDVSVLANDSDVDDDALTIQDATDPANGSITCDSDSCTYDPDPDFNGSDSFDYTVSDGNGGTDTATVTVTVAAVDDDVTAPVATGGQDAERISPNNDGKFDEMNVSADFSEESSWTLSIFSDESSGDDAMSLLGVGSPTPVYSMVGQGTRMGYTWDGVATDGGNLPEGSYRWELTGEDAAGNDMVGLEGTVELDLTAPVLTGVKATPRRIKLKLHRRTFRPQWPRRLVIRHGLSEAGTVRVKIMKGRRAIKNLKLATLSKAGTARSVWTGKGPRNKLVRPGRYQVVLTASDLVANTTVHRGLTITVKRAPKRSAPRRR